MMILTFNMNIKELHKYEFIDLPVQELQLILEWSNLDDLDLCVFYKSVEGKIGGVFTPEYNNNKESSGSLSSFPYIYLFGEPRPSATNCEDIVQISKLDAMEEINIVVIDYPRTINPEIWCNSSAYDFRLHINGEITKMRMNIVDSKNKGTICHIAKIVRKNDGFRLFNFSSFLSLSDAFRDISGFDSVIKSN